MNLYAGTSGFSYKEWKGSFYPKDLAAKEMLSYYAARLPAVEINNTFYRLPQKTVLENWRSQVPDNFRFSVKASQKITHRKRLHGVQEETTFFLDAAGALGECLGPVLFQLPPNMKKDLSRLESFISTLPEKTLASFEFRHPTWFEDDVLEVLSHKNYALCISDTDDLPVSHIEATSNWGYLRLRRVNYSDEDVARWLKRVHEQSWNQVFVFFKHEDGATGPTLARRFLDLANRSV